mgnify:CR=1 FL=1
MNWTSRSNAPKRNCGGIWIDTQNSLLAESTLMSFTAGFKLAWGMARELEADGLYSFEREEEEHICHPAEQED